MLACWRHGPASRTRHPPGLPPAVKIRAVSVFEGIVYQSFVVDPANPHRPTLEVEAVLRPGDADEGPLLLSVAEFLVMVGDEVLAASCVDALAAQGRVVTHLGVPYLTFPFWTPVDISGPGSGLTQQG